MANWDEPETFFHHWMRRLICHAWLQLIVEDTTPISTLKPGRILEWTVLTDHRLYTYTSFKHKLLCHLANFIGISSVVKIHLHLKCLKLQVSEIIKAEVALQTISPHDNMGYFQYFKPLLLLKHLFYILMEQAQTINVYDAILVCFSSPNHSDHLELHWNTINVAIRLSTNIKVWL